MRRAARFSKPRSASRPASRSCCKSRPIARRRPMPIGWRACRTGNSRSWSRSIRPGNVAVVGLLVEDRLRPEKIAATNLLPIDSARCPGRDSRQRARGRARRADGAAGRQLLRSRRRLRAVGQLRAAAGGPEGRGQFAAGHRRSGPDAAGRLCPHRRPRACSGSRSRCPPAGK